LPLAFGQQDAADTPHRRLLADARGPRRYRRPQALASGEFSTIRPRLLKIAARITETAGRIKLAFASNCPDAALFRGLVGTLLPRPT
jgi:hypothetical protein